MLHIVIGMINYTGVACGIAFEKSVGQNIPEDWDRSHVQVKRLLALFPGTTAEDVSGEKKDGTVGQDKEKVKADLEAALKIDEAARALDEEAVKHFPQPGTEEKTEEKTEETTEQAPEAGDDNAVSLAAGDSVMAEYKGDSIPGEVVKVLDSGVVRVKLEGDNANYRVFDDDKLERVQPEPANEE